MIHVDPIKPLGVVRSKHDGELYVVTFVYDGRFGNYISGVQATNGDNDTLAVDDCELVETNIPISPELAKLFEEGKE